ncbi:MAG: hypothetical protein ACOYL3_17855 [Desulfuromonadaceae bacterium]
MIVRIKGRVVQYFRHIFKPGTEYHIDMMVQAIFWIAGVSIIAILAFAALAVHLITAHEVKRNALLEAVKVGRSLFEQQKYILTSIGSEGKYYFHIDKTNIPVIDNYIRFQLHNFDILKIKIYSPSSEIIYSSDRKIIGKTDNENHRLKRALAGEVDSHIAKKDTMLDLAEEAKFNVSVVETYMPISVGNDVIGVFELYTDVTSYSQEIFQTVAATVFCLTIILLSIFAGAYQVLRKVIKLLRDSQQELADNVMQLRTALTNVKQLEGIIPICSWCKKIRDDKESWHQMENYISTHSEAKFSHGVCPECYEREVLEIMAKAS